MNRIGKTVILITCLSIASLSSAIISDLNGRYASGQVFLTWKENGLPAESTLRVYSHSVPITEKTLSSARLLASGIHVKSARDWWRDLSSFRTDKQRGQDYGFVVTPGGKELPPNSGLHVHTVDAAGAGSRYYAVTWEQSGQEHKDLKTGQNSLASPLAVKVAQRDAIWQGTTQDIPQKDCAKGLPLVFSLHGRGEGIPVNSSRTALNCLYFGDRTEGWREGLPFKFRLLIFRDYVKIIPCDRHWMNRPVLESPDSRDHVPAISTFWIGYNINANKTMDTPEIIVGNYTEAYLLGLMDWAQSYLGTDVNRTYLTGASMGGSGAISMALHFPHRIAAVQALVPIYSYTWKGDFYSANRLLCFCGPLKNRPSRLTDGRDLFQYLDGARLMGQNCDLPPIFATNGRRDMSIPWANNPPFYEAANAHKQALAVYWNNGNHGMSGSAPKDVKAWHKNMLKHRLNCSYPVFTNSSDNRDCGDGNPKKGDLIGWINRGMDWKDVTDTADQYRISIKTHYDGIHYPVTFDLTLRRLQNFKVKPGGSLLVKTGQTERKIRIGTDGLLTIPQISVTTQDWLTVQITRAKGN